MKTADQLPPPEQHDIPELPYSDNWERVFEPDWRSPAFADRREHHPTIRYVGSSTHLPETEMQALMEAKPHAVVGQSLESTAHLREPIADAIDGLPPRLRWIFEARTFRGLSLREVGRELSLSKSQVDRLYQQAICLLREELDCGVTTSGHDREDGVR